MIEIIPDHKPTNADMIRSLNDNELAKFLFKSQISILYDPFAIKTKPDFLAWLQREAE